MHQRLKYFGRYTLHEVHIDHSRTKQTVAAVARGTALMKEGLSGTFARLQQEEGGTHVGISLNLLKEIFFGQGPIPPPERMTTKLLVFAAGLPRTGTGSLAVALAELGYRPLHGPGIMELAPVLSEHYEGRAKPSDIISYAEDLAYDAQGMDQLGWKLYQEAAKTPDLKIILTEHPRGARGWAESWSSFAPDHIDYFSKPPFAFLPSLKQVMKLQKDYLSYLSEGTTKDPRDPLFVYPATALTDSYERHKEAVMRTVPEDRLLVFNPTQGWDPLCAFLRVDDENCPRNEYPHMTDRHLMMVMSKVAYTITIAWPLVFVVPAIIIWWRRRRRHGKSATRMGEKKD